MKFTNSTDLDTIDFYLTGDIVDDGWFEDDVTPNVVKDFLEQECSATKKINMIINSQGGSTQAGNAIINIFDNFRKKTNVVIDAYIIYAMSMATGVSMVADNVYMYANSLYMVHKPSTQIYGNANDMRKAAAVLDIVEETLIANYMRKFKGTEDELKEILAQETFMSAKQAKEYGLVDEVIESVKVAATHKGYTFDNFFYDKDEVSNIIHNFKEKEIEEMDEKQVETIDLSVEEIKLAMEKLKEQCEKAGVSIEDFVDTAPMTAIDEIGNEDVTELFAEEDKQGIQEFDEKFAELEQELDIANSQNNEQINKIKKLEIENKMFKDRVVNAALNLGVKAMGSENFNVAEMKNVLLSMNLESIDNLSKTWENQAKALLNAGKQVSQEGAKRPKKVNIQTSRTDNYNI